MIRAWFGLICLPLVPAVVSAQPDPAACRWLCAPAFNVEPTITTSNLFGSPRVETDGSTATRPGRDIEFELILSLDLSTRLSWLGFTIEAIIAPFDGDHTPELEFESNFTWLRSDWTRGWLGSHVDVVDKFSPAERPGDRRPYTHKLNLELDTALAVFNWLPNGRWLRGVEVEGSIDYVATGLPKAGDRIGPARFLDHASPWSLSIVFVLPVAPF